MVRLLYLHTHPLFLCLNSLHDNNIGKVGAVAVAGAMKENKTLTTLQYVLIDEGVWVWVINVEGTVIFTYSLLVPLSYQSWG